MIEVTPHAVNQLRTMLERKNASSATEGLRLAVEKGGCAGLNYTMRIAPAQPGDTIVERDGIRVIVDASSLSYLDGSTIDFEDSLNDAGFKIHNPNAARSCGCGTSFEPAPK